MRVVIVGTGYVGLVSGTCFSELGFSVTCIDKCVKKIDGLRQGILPIYEPGLQTLIEKNVNAGRLDFSTDLAEAVALADVVFIAVGTPQDTDGRADLHYVMEAAEEIAAAIKDYTVVVTKSTVPVDTANKLIQLISQHTPHFDIVSNPEFLREGSAIEDFMRPDRIVIGCRSEKARKMMETLYSPLMDAPLLFTNPESAELIKYASNCLLATKISFINEIADLCERVNADIHDVSKGVGMDTRLGTKFLNAGPGYGGSCFPKDTLALAHTAREYGAPLTVVEATITANTHRKKKMGERILSHLNSDSEKVAILGVTFKPDTDDMRDAPSLEIIPFLQGHGLHVFAYDPEGSAHAASFLPGVKWGGNAYEIMENADALVVLTEWNEFKAIDFKRVRSLMRRPLVIDLRNLYHRTDMAKYGFEYDCIGR